MDFKTATDGELMAALGNKSLSALEVLFDRHHSMAMAIAYKVLGDRSLSEDVVQEAFLAIWRKPESFNASRGAVRTWLLSIVRHRAIDVTRGRAFSRERVSLDEITLEPRLPDAWQDVSQKLQRQEIQQAVSQLPEEQKEAITMAYFGGYNQREIAEKTNVPLGTVKGRIRLGMQKLKATLSNIEMGEDD